MNVLTTQAMIIQKWASSSVWSSLSLSGNWSSWLCSYQENNPKQLSNILVEEIDMNEYSSHSGVVRPVSRRELVKMVMSRLATCLVRL